MISDYDYEQGMSRYEQSMSGYERPSSSNVHGCLLPKHLASALWFVAVCSVDAPPSLVATLLTCFRLEAMEVLPPHCFQPRRRGVTIHPITTHALRVDCLCQ